MPLLSKDCDTAKRLGNRDPKISRPLLEKPCVEGRGGDESDTIVYFILKKGVILQDMYRMSLNKIKLFLYRRFFKPSPSPI